MAPLSIRKVVDPTLMLSLLGPVIASCAAAGNASVLSGNVDVSSPSVGGSSERGTGSPE